MLEKTYNLSFPKHFQKGKLSKKQIDDFSSKRSDPVPPPLSLSLSLSPSLSLSLTHPLSFFLTYLFSLLLSFSLTFLLLPILNLVSFAFYSISFSFHISLLLTLLFSIVLSNYSSHSHSLRFYLSLYCVFFLLCFSLYLLWNISHSCYSLITPSSLVSSSFYPLSSPSSFLPPSPFSFFLSLFSLSPCQSFEALMKKCPKKLQVLFSFILESHFGQKSRFRKTVITSTSAFFSGNRKRNGPMGNCLFQSVLVEIRLSSGSGSVRMAAIVSRTS